MIDWIFSIPRLSKETTVKDIDRDNKKVDSLTKDGEKKVLTVICNKIESIFKKLKDFYTIALTEEEKMRAKKMAKNDEKYKHDMAKVFGSYLYAEHFTTIGEKIETRIAIHEAELKFIKLVAKITFGMIKLAPKDSKQYEIFRKISNTLKARIIDICRRIIWLFDEEEIDLTIKERELLLTNARLIQIWNNSIEATVYSSLIQFWNDMMGKMTASTLRIRVGKHAISEFAVERHLLELMIDFRDKPSAVREIELKSWLEIDKRLNDDLKALNMLNDDEKVDVTALLQGEHQKLNNDKEEKSIIQK